jgi:hypothetical protein
MCAPSKVCCVEHHSCGESYEVFGPETVISITRNGSNARHAFCCITQAGPRPSSNLHKKALHSFAKAANCLSYQHQSRCGVGRGSGHPDNVIGRTAGVSNKHARPAHRGSIYITHHTKKRSHLLSSCSGLRSIRGEVHGNPAGGDPVPWFRTPLISVSPVTSKRSTAAANWLRTYLSGPEVFST